VSSAGLKGLPGDLETAPKGDRFGALWDWNSALTAAAINPCEEITALYSYSAFDNDVRKFAGLDHLVGLAPSETDHPGNITDAVKQLFNVPRKSSHVSTAFPARKNRPLASAAVHWP